MTERASWSRRESLNCWDIDRLDFLFCCVLEIAEYPEWTLVIMECYPRSSTAPNANKVLKLTNAQFQQYDGLFNVLRR